MLINFTTLKHKYKMNITGIIHIGGHYGEEIEEYLDNGIQDIVIFEPLERNFSVLYENVKSLSANIQGHQVALGSQRGTATMYVSNNDAQSSSILRPKEHLIQHPHVQFNETEEVDVETLDSYNLTEYNFINMDVQGYELEVLKGGLETLNNIDYIYCEVNRGEVYENNVHIGELDEFLSSYNFERVETSWPREDYLWGDALYIKNK